METQKANDIEGLLLRAKKLTDQAWMARNAGREFDYRRVEEDFERLLASLNDSKVQIGDQAISFDQLHKLISGLAHANRNVRRNGELAAFAHLVDAFEPLADKAKLLDTGS